MSVGTHKGDNMEKKINKFILFFSIIKERIHLVKCSSDLEKIRRIKTDTEKFPGDIWLKQKLEAYMTDMYLTQRYICQYQVWLFKGQKGAAPKNPVKSGLWIKPDLV